MIEAKVFDWVELVGGLLWVLGLAVCLAALSMSRYQARVAGESVFSRLQRPGLWAALASGMGIFCIGLLLVSGPWWQRVIWALGTIVSFVWAVRAWKGRQSATEAKP